MYFGIFQRAIHTTPAIFLKKINVSEDKTNNLIKIEAEYIDPEEKFGKKLLNFDLGEKKLNSEAIARPCAFSELGIT